MKGKCFPQSRRDEKLVLNMNNVKIIQSMQLKQRGVLLTKLSQLCSWQLECILVMLCYCLLFLLVDIMLPLLISIERSEYSWRISVLEWEHSEVSVRLKSVASGQQNGAIGAANMLEIEAIRAAQQHVEVALSQQIAEVVADENRSSHAPERQQFGGAVATGNTSKRVVVRADERQYCSH